VVYHLLSKINTSAAICSHSVHGFSARFWYETGTAQRMLRNRKQPMKFATDRPYSDPAVAARKLLEIANSVEPVQEGRIFVELINGPFLFERRGTPAEYKAGLDLALVRGWLEMHESGTYVKFTRAGADLFA
jgi:hypothetical protein